MPDMGQRRSVEHYNPTSASKKDGNCRNVARDSQGSGANDTNNISVASYHGCKYAPADHERFRSPKQQPKTFHHHPTGLMGIEKGGFSVKPKVCGLESFQEPTSEKSHKLNTQTGRAEDVPADTLSTEKLLVGKPVKKQQANQPAGKPPKVSNDFLDDRDDVGEWRAEMHDIQYYYFD